MKIIDYSFMQANGEPLPQWISKFGSDLLVEPTGEGHDTITIKARILFDDGLSVNRTIELNVKTGEVTEPPLRRRVLFQCSATSLCL